MGADGPDSDHTEGGYDAQSENDSADDATPRRPKRFTARSRQPVDTADLASLPGSSSSPGNSTVERSESGHALFYDPELKGWRRDEAGASKRHKSTGPLSPEELTPSVTNLKRTHSGTPIVQDRWKGYWHRERRHKTVNFNKLTPAQQDAKRTASGTDIYYDERRLEWRRWREHSSDVPTPTKAQQLLKRTGSGSAIVYDSTRKVWKRKLKRMGPLGSEHLLEAQREADTGWERHLVQDKGSWYLDKKRKHLQDGELSKRQLKAQRTSSGTSVAYDSVHRRWKRVTEPDDATTSGADRSDLSSRGTHRHHHGFKRISHVYTKHKVTGKWTKKQVEDTDYLNKRLRTPDGGYVFFDEERMCWRKAKVDVPEEKRLGYFGRVREYLFGEDDDENEIETRATAQHFQTDSAQYSVAEQQQQLRLTPGSGPGPARRQSYRPGLWRRIKRFFTRLCRFLKIC